MKIYLAFEYGRRAGYTDEQCQKNVDECLVMARKLIKMGHNPFIPLLWHYVHLGWRHSPDEEKYFQLVSDWIEDCDSLLVGKMPTWENSGVIREIEIADKLFIPVYYSIDEMEDLNDKPVQAQVRLP